MNVKEKDYYVLVARRTPPKQSYPDAYVLNRDMTVRELDEGRADNISIDNLFSAHEVREMREGALKDMKFEVRDRDGDDWRGDTKYVKRKVALEFEERPVNVTMRFFKL